MEMHSRQSLYEIRGISLELRRRRSRLTARLLVTRIFEFLARVKRAIEAVLAARQVIAELASMNNQMLRDLGINRCEIENAGRRPRAKVGADDTPVFLNDAGGSCKICEGCWGVAPNTPLLKNQAGRKPG